MLITAASEVGGMDFDMYRNVFKILKIARAAGECNLKNQKKKSRVTIYHEMHERSYDFLSIIVSTKL